VKFSFVQDDPSRSLAQNRPAPVALLLGGPLPPEMVSSPSHSAASESAEHAFYVLNLGLADALPPNFRRERGRKNDDERETDNVHVRAGLASHSAAAVGGETRFRSRIFLTHLLRPGPEGRPKRGLPH